MWIFIASVIQGVNLCSGPANMFTIKLFCEAMREEKYRNTGFVSVRELGFMFCSDHFF